MSKVVEEKKSTKEINEKDTKKNETKKDSVKKNSAKKTVSKKKENSIKKPGKSSSEVLEKASISLEEADSFYHISLLAQAVCVIGILFISILAIFEHSFTVPIEVLVGITLLIMAYNNERVFVRRGLTVVYLIFGIVCLLVGILGYFGVNV